MRRSNRTRRAVVSAPIAIAASAALVFVLSCESFSASHDAAGVVTDAPAADERASFDASKDAAVEAMVLTDGGASDAGQNLFPLGDFESGLCSGGGYYSSLTPDPTSHSGASSCRVCTDGTSPDVFSFYGDVPNVTPQVGATFVAEAWVRSSPSASAPAKGVELIVRTETAASVSQESASTPRAVLSATWQHLTIPLAVTQAGFPKLAVIVDGQYSAGTCFLVDDIVVRREQ